MTPDEIVEILGLEPHPEGGMYRETWRGAQSAIYYLLRAGEISRGTASTPPSCGTTTRARRSSCG